MLKVGLSLPLLRYSSARKTLYGKPFDVGNKRGWQDYGMHPGEESNRNGKKQIWCTWNNAWSKTLELITVGNCLRTCLKS
jgi:hypothetical protein